jgi:hypothetical protein
MKLKADCSICMHEKRLEILEDHFKHSMPIAKIAEKYFPERKLAAVRRSLRVHFKKHQNIDEEARVATTLVLSQPQDGSGKLPITKSEERIFTAAVRERIEAAILLERMLSSLMGRANRLEDQAEEILASEPGKCRQCGEACGHYPNLADYLRDKDNLSRMLNVFKEIRGQLGMLLKVKNPVSIIEKMGERAFLAFVRGMTALYIRIIVERHKTQITALNQFLIDGQTPPLVAAISGSDDDYGASLITSEAEALYNRILNTTLRELRAT